METGFVWKGTHSNEKGLKIISLPNITTSEKREEKIIIPGRDGYLTQSDESYEGEVKPVEFDIKHDNFDEIKTWLNGSGEVIFSNEPDRYYKARIINKLDLARVLEKFHSGIIQFDCQPFGYDLNNNLIII
ncbi:phage tail protein, partial [Clostridium botulinum]|nr:phage tail protein [Clostridium botulinum]